MAIFKAVVNPATGAGIGHATPQKLEDYLKYEQERDERGLRKVKTEYVSAINADADDFSASCADVSARFNSCREYDSLKYKHYVQGFAPEDSYLMTEADCHALGAELAREIWGDFPVLVVSHYEQEVEGTGEYHWHNHFLVYNCAVTDGHKIDTSRTELWAQKLYVAAQAKAHALTQRGLVIENGELRSSRMDERESMAEKHVRLAGQANLDRENAASPKKEIRERTFMTQKAELRLAIRAARAKTSGLYELCRYLEEVYGVKTKESRGQLSFLHPDRVGSDRAWIRGKSLGDKYTKEAIVNGFNKQADRRADIREGYPAGGSAAEREGEREFTSAFSASGERLSFEERISRLQELYRDIFKEGGRASTTGREDVGTDSVRKGKKL
jgi:hypothetical protein